MKFSALFAGCLFAAAAAMPATAHETVYTTLLDGSSEAPPNTSAGTGMAKITIDFDLVTMRVEESFSGLQGNVTAAHIHCCTAVPLYPELARLVWPLRYPHFLASRLA